MFLRSSNMTAPVRILSYVRVGGLSNMAASIRKWIYTTHFLQTLMWMSFRISPVMMLDAQLTIGFELHAVAASATVVREALHPPTRSRCSHCGDRAMWRRSHQTSRRKRKRRRSRMKSSRQQTPQSTNGVRQLLLALKAYKPTSRTCHRRCVAISLLLCIQAEKYVIP